MTPVRRLLLLVSVLVAAGCGGTPTVNTDPDSGVPDGTVDECENVVSCDDPLADECGLECPDPVSFCNLGDPNRFIPDGCGFNDRGELEQRCIFSLEYDDYVWDDVECVDPDECVIDEVDERSCGINDIGSEYRTCENGHWTEFGSCEFAEYLTHDDFYTDAGATFYNEGDSWNEAVVEVGEEFTVSMWVNRIEGTTGRIISTSSGAIRIGNCNGSVCDLRYGDTVVAIDDLPVGSFHHFVVTVSSVSGMVVYLDGVEIASDVTPYNGEAASTTLTDGPAAEVKHLSFFDGVLTADEIAALYNYGF